jgi:hypothetical protein
MADEDFDATTEDEILSALGEDNESDSVESAD